MKLKGLPQCTANERLIFDLLRDLTLFFFVFLRTDRRFPYFHMHIQKTWEKLFPVPKPRNGKGELWDCNLLTTHNYNWPPCSFCFGRKQLKIPTLLLPVYSSISASLPLVTECFFQQADKHYGTRGTLNHWWFIKHIEISIDQLLWPSDDLSLGGASLLRPPFTAPRCSLCTSLKAHTGPFSCCHQHRNHSKATGQSTHPKDLEVTALQGQQTWVSTWSKQAECFQ